jgi:hypothetical protein
MNNIQVSSSYKVGDKVFNSLEDANKYIIGEMISNGVDWIIENKVAFISALNQVGNPNLKTPPSGRIYSNTGKGNLDGVKEMLKGRYEVRRDEDSWPVYHFHNDTEYHVIRYTGKVWELYDLVRENLSDLTPIFKMYGK